MLQELCRDYADKYPVFDLDGPPPNRDTFTPPWTGDFWYN